jgi:hypothetical protein
MVTFLNFECLKYAKLTKNALYIYNFSESAQENLKDQYYYSYL